MTNWQLQKKILINYEILLNAKIFQLIFQRESIFLSSLISPICSRSVTAE